MSTPSQFKNVMFIDAADNGTYDVFAATTEEFNLFFPMEGQDIAFMDEIWPSSLDLDFAQPAPPGIQEALKNFWERRLVRAQAMGIHGLIFGHGLEFKKEIYPNRRDSDNVAR